MEKILTYNGLDIEMIDVVNSKCPSAKDDNEDYENEEEFGSEDEY